jgi:hypothetical protein
VAPNALGRIARLGSSRKELDAWRPASHLLQLSSECGLLLKSQRMRRRLVDDVQGLARESGLHYIPAMNAHPCTFPFGAPVRQVMQVPDGSKKRAFIVGIYSSAVHARWIGLNGQTKIAALAVANEPYIFWRGDNAREHIPTIDERLGRLVPASPGNNGPSGKALDESYLNPLGLSRDETWLSDLVPHTLSNKKQRHAIENYYGPLLHGFALPKSTVPCEPENEAEWAALVDERRLLEELRQSEANTIVTLGNRVIKSFLNRVCATSFARLTERNYGLPRPATIDGKLYKVICLAHMRVTTIRPTPIWQETHQSWIASCPRPLI